jgi:hypothetical protein
MPEHVGKCPFSSNVKAVGLVEEGCIRYRGASIKGLGERVSHRVMWSGRERGGRLNKTPLMA